MGMSSGQGRHTAKALAAGPTWAGQIKAGLDAEQVTESAVTPTYEPSENEQAAAAVANLEVAHDNADVTCAYCGGMLYDGDSHFHGGQPNPDDQRLPRDMWQDATRRYNEAVTAAYEQYKANCDAAWQLYRRGTEAADLSYNRAMATAGADYDAAVNEANRGK